MKMYQKMAKFWGVAAVICLGMAPFRVPALEVENSDPANNTRTNAPAADEPKGARVEVDTSDKSTVHVELHEMVRVGSDVHVRANESSHEVVAILGSATVDGKASGDVVVILGSATVNGTVEGSVVNVMGTTTLGPKAKVQGDVITVGGPLKADPAAKISGQRINVSLGAIWPDFGWLKDYCLQGVWLARPLPPGLGWVWVITAALMVLYLFIALLFPKPVAACVSVLDERPLAAMVAGILAFILIGPLFLLLVISVAGILVIPFVACGMVAIFFFGKVAVYEFAGAQLLRQVGVNAAQKPLIALVLGLALFSAFYMVPVLGFIVWGLIIPMGIGAVLLAWIGNVRRDRHPPASALPTPLPPRTGLDGASPGATAAAGATYPPGIPPVMPAAAEMAGLPCAGFWIRLGATALDVLLVYALLSYVRFDHFLMLIWMTYHIALWTWKGTTIGGMVFGLKVVRQNGQPVDVGVAVVRSLGCLLSAGALFLGFFWVGWDKDKLGWHDKIAGTMIVKMPKGIPLITL